MNYLMYYFCWVVLVILVACGVLFVEAFGFEVIVLIKVVWLIFIVVMVVNVQFVMEELIYEFQEQIGIGVFFVISFLGKFIV